MRIMIVFSSVEGQTRKISEHIAERIKSKGHEVDLVEAATDPAALAAVTDADAVIVASSVHQKVHHEAVVDFALAHRADLEARPGAFISVSLAIAMPDGGREEAQGYIDGFVSETGWKPTASLPVAGALKYDEYDFFKQQIVKFVVVQKGLDVTPGEDHEFTDWAGLDQFIDTFSASAAA